MFYFDVQTNYYLENLIIKVFIMQSPSCPQSHTFSYANEKGEKRTLYVLLLTLITMAVEISAGSIYGSMALLADGWHMGTHAAAFCITLFTFRYARKHQDSRQYTFGTGKVGVLGGLHQRNWPGISGAIYVWRISASSVQSALNPV